VGGQVGGGPFLANAGLIFIPLIVLAAACAFFFMDNLRVSRSELREQLRVARNGHTWLMSVLYIGTFGSFIGYSGALPILLSLNFPDAGLKLAFLGALVGSLARPIGGLLSDRFGGARVTLGNFGVMIVAALGVIFCLQNKAEPWAFTAFLGMFMVLFMATGIGNGSTFRMIPVIFRAQALDRNRGDREQAIRIGKRETAAVLGVSSAIGAYGGFLIPQGFSLSRTATGGPQAALYVFIGFYLICAAITWWCYVRQREVAGRRPVLGEARA
jgi:NNP family nitrate/nitrite transporter-like MFS transporter